MRQSLLALLLFTAACGTTARFSQTNPSPKPMVARPPETVTVFTSSPPAQPYVDVGIIQARQSSEFSMDEMPEIITEMRAEAAARGCDGLVIGGSSDKQEGGSIWVDHHRSTHTIEGFWGTCIVFTQPAVASTQGIE